VLTFWAVSMIAVLIALIMSGRVSPVIALILTPTVFGVMAGFGIGLGPMMLKGVQQLTPTAVMLGFAILYFGVMVDAGLFDPLVSFVVRAVHGDPVRIILGSAVLALALSLDGNGATAYIICSSAMVPLYKRTGLDPLILACISVLSISIGHVTPWAGPTARLGAVLGVETNAIYVPLIPAMALGAASVLLLAYYFGLRERRRLQQAASQMSTEAQVLEQATLFDPAAKRPRLYGLNLIITAVLLLGLVQNLVPLPVVFMIAAAIVLQINYPSLKDQRARFIAHAPNIFRVTSITFGAGIFLGVLQGTGMNDALAASVASAIPTSAGPYMALIAVGTSLPFYYFTSNDGFFFGVLPVLAKTASQYGINPVEMARAATIGAPVNLLSPLAASTYVLVSMVGISYSQLQRFTLKWALLLSLILLVGAILTSVIPVHGPGAGSYSTQHIKLSPSSHSAKG
jgi:citrate-Mg2+:H+ or citrate-Ca2+:H+ symporter, CitMHS family